MNVSDSAHLAKGRHATDILQKSLVVLGTPDSCDQRGSEQAHKHERSSISVGFAAL